MNRRDRNQWGTASTLAELGHQMARWLDGDLRSCPTYYGRADLDTPEMTRLCAGLCRAGVVTINSQAAGHWWDSRGEGYARAYIAGFAVDHSLARLRKTCGTPLIVIAHRTPPRRWFTTPNRSQAVPVVTVDGQVRLTAGEQLTRGDVETIWDGCWVSDQAWVEVLDAWQVTIVDPRWGCGDHLANMLTRVGVR